MGIFELLKEMPCFRCMGPIGIGSMNIRYRDACVGCKRHACMGNAILL